MKENKHIEFEEKRAIELFESGYLNKTFKYTNI